MLSTILFSLQNIVLQYGWVAVAHAISGVPPAICPPGAICNPLQWNSILDLLNHLLSVLMVVSGALVVAIIALAGLFYVTSLGDPKKRKAATDMVTWALIGFAIILLARVIVSIVSSVLP